MLTNLLQQHTVRLWEGATNLVRLSSDHRQHRGLRDQSLQIFGPGSGKRWHWRVKSVYNADSNLNFGDIFTFTLFGGIVTVYLGSKGNQDILNGKFKDVNSEDIYSALTTPDFGKDFIYDVLNARFMEQKKVLLFIVFDWSSLIALIVHEIRPGHRRSAQLCSSDRG